MSSALLRVSLQGEYGEQSDDVFDGETTLRIENPAAENGFEQEPGPLTWLNSARIVTNPDDDEVYAAISVGDPRGCFVFSVRRLEDGRFILGVPHENDPMPHMDLERLSPGTLRTI